LVGFSDRVREFLRNFDCFLLTSKVEGLPNVIIEAQACGVPVVSTDAGGARECLMEGETGLICYDGTPIEICNNLIEVITDKQFSRKASNVGVKYAKKKFGIKAYSKKINRIYSEVGK